MLISLDSHATHNCPWQVLASVSLLRSSPLMELFRNWSEKLEAKFLETTLEYFMVKIACLSDAFSEIIFELGASPVEGETLPQER